MSSKDVLSNIGKAIREGKYLSISYENKDGKTTKYWICILDIFENDRLEVNMFNVTKDEPILNAKIFISKIRQSEILKFSYCDVKPELIKKINEDPSLDKYQFDQFDNRILNYYLECYKANQDPFLYKQHLIPGIDLNVLASENPYILSSEQLKSLIKDVYHNEYEKYYGYELALSDFSIDLSSKGKFVVAYRKLSFDPVAKTLKVGEQVKFNSVFYIKNIKYSLSYYTDLSPNDFENNYINNKEECIAELKYNFRSGELPNTRPEIVVLGYSQKDISEVYERINNEHLVKNLQIPLKAFFRNCSLLDRKDRKEPNIVLFDENVNIDQLRTVYNSMKFPITYVQGPPGTGKTQTILNIVVNCFTNNKTLLVSSNNNTPIDGINEKLKLGHYKNKEILFPIIRLGNNDLVAKALLKIEELFDFNTTDVPKENLLIKLKENSKEKNKNLLRKLKNFEERLDLEQNLTFINGLMAKCSIPEFLEEKKKIEQKLIGIPVITDADVKGIFEVIQGNPNLLQFFYFESLKYIKRLNPGSFSDLLEIVKIDNNDKKVKDFNKWIGIDENLERFTKVFPVILTTNISSIKLGKEFKFDLLAIDEAAQCDIATSLIPISKCKNMVLIGDVNQLKPIVIFDESKNDYLMKLYEVDKVYDYFNNSILSLYKQIDNISRDILLSYHYRCGKKIINYSNMRFYENRLNLSNIQRTGSLKLLNVTNANSALKNSQFEEANELVNYIIDNKLSDVFIITPFRNQEKLINEIIDIKKNSFVEPEKVKCGTIHKIQGQENKTIIISTSISKKTSPGTYNWIKNNSQLLNVGVTRAKENLIVAVDKYAIDILSRKDDDLYSLIDYIDKNGENIVTQSQVNKFTIGFSNDSRFEDEFYKTMSHYCTIKGSRYVRNVKVLDIFPEELKNNQVNKREFDGVLYEKSVPKIVFEINGNEHYTKRSRIKSDMNKMELLKSKNIAFFMIPNQYVKHYEFIRELINKLNHEPNQYSLFEEL